VGTFPFGRPATDRPPRVPAGDADLFVLGVYPSALHVRWQSSDGVVQIQALAVDDEPKVFWDGADAAERVRRWTAQVGWQSSWGRVSPSGNGTSGRAVVDDVLRPLGTTIERCYVTDCVPRYLLKNGSASQGRAIEEHYAPFAAARGLPAVSLPSRPTPATLVANAVQAEGQTLVEQLVASRAEVVVTLGQEAADVLAAVLGAEPVVLRRDESYGRELLVEVAGTKRAWLPLKHPGLRVPAWRARHDDWKAALRC
jgi:hypothetical protein